MKFLSRTLASLAGLASYIALCHSANAQIGLSSIQAGTVPITLVYSTDAVSKTTSFGAFELNVAVNAAPLSKTHRLVVLSHGSGGSALSDHGLASALARAGFIVAQPLHAGDNFRDKSKSGPSTFQSRPREASQVIDALAKHPQWSAKLELTQVGVHGMSAGGVTGLALAGGQWRTLNLVQHCNRVQEADEGFCFAGALSGAARAERAAGFNAAKIAPEVFLPADLKAVHGGLTPSAAQPDVRPDARIAAVTLSVPLAAIFSAESLARIRVPVGLVTAKNDQVLVPRFHSDHVLAHCRSCVQLADLPAEHFDLLSPWPDSVARETAKTQVRGGLPKPGFDAKLRDAAFAQIVQFHLKHLSPVAQAKP